MSTEHQQYSLENQAAAIKEYASARGFEVVRTYSDAARSGLVLRHRTGLQQLLHDVLDGASIYRAILVYDVSRWGRFQDTDESAHYEFLCKSAGVPVHYCAETFANDGSLPSLIMKALKRTMAGEYSRELGVKILAGQKRVARLGFKLGGLPGYGLRRMLVSSDRVPKQELTIRERKSIASDRVLLIPGPTEEVECVKGIYRMLVSEGRTVCGIARELNRRGVQRQGSSKWDYNAVHAILTHPKYIGCSVFGRTSRRLHTPTVQTPQSEWIVEPGVFRPVIDPATYARAQNILEQRTFSKTDEQLLDKLRVLQSVHHRLSYAIIKNAVGVPAPSTYRRRFGCLRRAYELVGYRPGYFDSIDTRRRISTIREGLIGRIVSSAPREVKIVKRCGTRRSRLRLRNGVVVSVLVARSLRVWKDTRRWLVDPVRRERRFVMLLARLDGNNSSIFDLHLFANMDRAKRFHLTLNSAWLKRGRTVPDLSHVCKIAMQLAADRST